MESIYNKLVSFKIEHEDWMKLNKIAKKNKTSSSQILRKLVAKEIEREGL